MTENDIITFLLEHQATYRAPEQLTLHQCCVIMPTRIVAAHEAAGCLGKAPRFDEVAALLEDLS